MIVIALAGMCLSACTRTDNAPVDPAGLSGPVLTRLLEQLDPEKDDALQAELSAGRGAEEALAVSELHYGSFTARDADELLVLYRFTRRPPHGAGYDRVIAALYDRADLALLTQHSLTGDRVSLLVLPVEETGRSLLFVLSASASGGAWSQTQELFSVERSGWRAQELDSSIFPAYQYDPGKLTERFTYCAPGNAPDELLLFAVKGDVGADGGVTYAYSPAGAVRWNVSTGRWEGSGGGS